MKRLPAPLLILSYKTARAITRLGFGKKKRSRNLEKNRLSMKKHPLMRGAFIEDQSRFHDLSYGNAGFDKTGCGVVAMYNAFTQLGKKVDLPTLISQHELFAMTGHGHLGTSPANAGKLLRMYGCRGRGCTNPSKFDTFADSFPLGVFLLTIVNHKSRMRSGLHTICLVRKKEGFLAHNAEKGRPYGPLPSIASLISHLRDGDALGIYLLGIEKIPGI